jgi:hypothetical protein
MSAARHFPSGGLPRRGLMLSAAASPALLYAAALNNRRRDFCRREGEPVMTLVLRLLVSLASLAAQIAGNPSGHWEGTIQAPGLDVRIEVDLAKRPDGSFEGTLTNPTRKIKGLPFAKVEVDGATIAFYAREDQGFSGLLSGDGKLMSGEYSGSDFSVPFSLTRTGDARIERPAKSPRIGKELEGVWTGTLDDNATASRLVLTLANDPDGTSSGTLLAVDLGGLKLPVVAIAQKASRVTFDIKAFGTAFAGTLNAAGTELAGTYTNPQGVALPLTFHRDAGQ